MLRRVVFIISLWHQASSQEPASRVHVVGTMTMVASVPSVLQETKGVNALKTGIADALPGVTPGMLDVSVLIATSRRLGMSSGPVEVLQQKERRLQFGLASEVFVDYRVIFMTADTTTASFVKQRIEGAQVQLMLHVQNALSVFNISTLVANMKVSAPVIRTIGNSSCVFRFWRFMPVTTRAAQAASGVALGSLIFYNADMQSLSVAQVNVGNASNGAVPINAFDGDPASNWHSLALLPLEIDFQAPTDIAFYRWSTSSITSSADPIRWRLEVSSDSLAWNVVDDRAATDHMTPVRRQVPAGLFRIGCSGALPPIAMAGANSSSGTSPLLIIVIVLIAIFMCGVCVGGVIFAYRKTACYLIGLQRKRSRVLPEEQATLAKTHLQGDSKINLDIDPMTGLPTPTGKKVDLQTLWHASQFEDTPEAPVSSLADDVTLQAHRALPFANQSQIQKDTSCELLAEDTSFAEDPTSEPEVHYWTEEERKTHVYPEGTLVGVVGLVEHHHNNGHMAEVVRYDTIKEKYIVRIVSSGQKVVLKAENLILAMCQDMLEDLEEEIEAV